MEIIVGDVSSSIHTDNARVIGIVRELCQARPDGYRYMPKYINGHWDGYISLMTGMKSFPTGLLNYVVKGLKDAGFPNITIIDNIIRRKYSEVTENSLEGITLRDYQIKAANAMLLAGRGIAKMATNSGKTEVMSAVIKALNSKTMVVVHRKELLYQTAERIAIRTGYDVGIVGDGKWIPADITVAMIQSLYNNTPKLGYWKNNHILIIDECHHVSSDQMMDVLKRIPGPYRFGLSGTPIKYNVLADMKLMAMTGDIVTEVGNKYLIDEGYSAVPVVNIIVVESDDSDMWELGYHNAYKSLIVDNCTRNEKIASIAKSSNGTTLIIVNFIDHGIRLSEMIEGSSFVTGEEDSGYRLSILDRMRSGKGGVFIATNIFDEGVDVPAIDTLIIACGGKARHKLLQRVGRGMRKKENDNTIKIYDFMDDTNRYLMRHTESRVNVYKEEGFEIKLL